MAMGRESDRQSDLMVTWAEIPSSPGHVFYDRLQEVLIAAVLTGFCRNGVPALLRAKDGRTDQADGAAAQFAD